MKDADEKQTMAGGEEREGRTQGVGRCRAASFELFCRLEEHLQTCGFADGQPLLPGRAAPARLEMLFRTGAMLSLMQGGVVPAMLCNDALGREPVIVELIKQCDLKSVRRMMDYFAPGDPMQDLLKQRMKELREGCSAEGELKLLQTGQSGFYDYLTDVIRSRGYRKNSDFYNYAGITRQTFFKIKTSDVVSRELALHLAVALELGFTQAEELMARAGYCLKAVNRREAIIEYIMRKGSYRFEEVEEALYLLGERGFLK